MRVQVPFVPPTLGKNVREIFIDKKVYYCDMFDAPLIINEGYLRLTITGPDKPFFRLLKSMKRTGKYKRFKANAILGIYTGKFSVADICNDRCIIMNVSNFSSAPYPKEDLT